MQAPRRAIPTAVRVFIFFFFLLPYFGHKKTITQKSTAQPKRAKKRKKVYNEIVTEKGLTNKSFYGKILLFLSRGTPTRTPPHFWNYLRNLP